MDKNTAEKNICDVLKFEGIMSRGFGIAPRIVMRDKRLSVEAKAIYCYLQSFAGSNLKAFPNRSTILEELNISKNRYYKYLNELIEYNYIRIEREKTESNWKGRNIYIIVANPESENPEPLQKKVNKTSSHGETKLNSDNGVHREHNFEHKENVSHCETNYKFRNCSHSDHNYKKENACHDDTNYCDELYKKLQIERLIKTMPKSSGEFKAIFTAIKDMVSSEEIKIGGNVKKKEAILTVLEQLTYKNIICVSKAVRENKSSIKNKRAWIQTCLYNSIYDDENEIEQIVKSEEARCNNLKRKIDEKKEEIQNKEHILIKHPYVTERNKILKSLAAKRAKAVLFKNEEEKIKCDSDIKKIENDIKDYAGKHDLEFELCLG